MPRFRALAGKAVVAETDADAIELGTASSCVVPLEDPIAAELHAAIRHERGRFLLRDLGSATGTYRNGLPVEGEVPLSHGDAIVLGSSRITAAIEGGERGFELVLQVEAKGFFAAKGDRDELVRAEVVYGRSRALAAANWAAGAAAVVLVLAALLAPGTRERLVDPGPLHRAHAAFFEEPMESFSGERAQWAAVARERGCETCHEPFGGTTVERCMLCHASLANDHHPFQERLSARSAGGEARMAADVATWLAGGCALCHVDHRGADPGPGGLVPALSETRASCADCHASTDFDLDGIDAPLPVPDEREVELAFVTFPHAPHIERQIDCGVCHGEPRPRDLRPALPAADPRAGRDFAIVAFETCTDCHAKDAEARDGDPDLWASDENRVRVDWHGTDDEGNCLRCHAALREPDLRRVPFAPAELAFALRRRAHETEFAEVRLPAHLVPGDGERRNGRCEECHAGTPGGVAAETASGRPFLHGLHVSELRPGAAGAGGGPSAAEISEMECARCHAEQLDADGLAVPTYRGATGDCGECHVTGTDGVAPSLPPGEVERLDSLVARVERVDFPHTLHLFPAGAEDVPSSLAEGCFACHAFELGSGRREAVPTTRAEARSCTPCHENHANVGGGSCTLCHGEGDRVYGGELLARPWPERGAFEHASPGHRDVGCVVCHPVEVDPELAGSRRSIAAARRVDEVPIPRESDAACRACHVEERGRFHWR